MTEKVKKFVEELKALGFEEVEGEPMSFTHKHIPSEVFDMTHGAPDVSVAISNLFYYGRMDGKAYMQRHIREMLGIRSER